MVVIPRYSCNGKHGEGASQRIWQDPDIVNVLVGCCMLREHYAHGCRVSHKLSMPPGPMTHVVWCAPEAPGGSQIARTRAA